MNMDTKSRRNQADNGTALERLIHDMMSDGKYTQAEIAYYLGISQKHMSFILNPLCQDTHLSIVHIPTVLELLDGEDKILRAICKLRGKVPVDLPCGEARDGDVYKEIAEWQLSICNGLKDGSLDAADIAKIEKEMLDAFAAWKKLAGRTK